MKYYLLLLSCLFCECFAQEQGTLTQNTFRPADAESVKIKQSDEMNYITILKIVKKSSCYSSSNSYIRKCMSWKKNITESNLNKSWQYLTKLEDYPTRPPMWGEWLNEPYADLKIKQNGKRFNVRINSAGFVYVQTGTIQAASANFVCVSDKCKKIFIERWDVSSSEE